MKLQKIKGLFAIVAVVVLASCSSNWPQFRGPESNQLPDEKNLPTEWGEDKNVVWKNKLDGRGWSCPITWGNKLYFTEAVLLEVPSDTSSEVNNRRPNPNPPNGIYSFEVKCLDIETGEVLWKNVAFKGNPGFKIHRENTYASETPVTDGKRIYAWFGNTGIYCYDMTGNLIWEKELKKYKMAGDWGTSASPVLYKDLLIMTIDNEEESFTMALDTKTGQEIWKVDRDEKSTYSTGIIWKNKVRTELVTVGSMARSYDPETGDLFWELNMGGGRSSSSAVADREAVYFGNEKRRSGGGILFAVRAGATGNITPEENESSSDGVMWSVPESGISMPSPLLYEGNVYITQRIGGKISCFNALTGEPAYKGIEIPDAGAFWASPWAYEGKIYCPDEKGVTHVLEAGDEFKVLATNKLEDILWSTPIPARGGYVFRGVEYMYYVK